jgi:hypothetical protein
MNEWLILLISVIVAIGLTGPLFYAADISWRCVGLRHKCHGRSSQRR